jgi:fatty acid desaturase
MATTTATKTAAAPVMMATAKGAQSTPYPDVKTMRDAIPAKCFERSMVRSFSYVARDLVAVSLLFYSAVQLAGADLPLYLSVPLWTLYSFVTGCFFTGLWILAHECGHDSFSDNLTVNAATGWVLHCMLLVPFFSWKFTHSRHHRYANHMEKDTVFVPNRKPGEKSEKKEPTMLQSFMDHQGDTPIVSIIALAIHQLFGWPAYMLMNAGAGVKSLTRGNRKETPRLDQNHLNPTAAVFTKAEQPYVLLSNIGVLLTFTALYFTAQSIGGWNTFLLYGVPYLWMNHWIGKFNILLALQNACETNSKTVAITYLHHTHPEASHYEAENWTYAKGALSTVDREFGFIGRHIFHGIIEYHVVHHIFP